MNTHLLSLIARIPADRIDTIKLALVREHVYHNTALTLGTNEGQKKESKHQ